MSFNLTRAKLKEFTDTRAFEQMCSSLLVSDYPHIIPLGGIKDRGRDAIAPTVLKDLFQNDNAEIIFQFSTEKSWEYKLKRELKKVLENGYSPEQYLFITTQDVSATDYDKARKYSIEHYHLPLQIYDVSWLQSRLENPEYLNIRHQYLGLDEGSLPAFLVTQEYADRRIDRGLAPDLNVFLGRIQEVEQIKNFLNSTNRIMVLTGLPGIGKTRLLIETAKIIESNETVKVRFIRPEVESLESHFNELNPLLTYLLILDDAHNFGNLSQLLSLLNTPEFKDKLRIITVTHPWSKDQVLREFEGHGYTCEELRLQRMANVEISQLVQDPVLNITTGNAIDGIVIIAKGNPLIAVVATKYFIDKGTLSGFTRDRLLSAYMAGILVRATKDKQDTAYILLAIIAATEGLNNTDPDIRGTLLEVINISEGALDVLIGQLNYVGLLKKTWQGIKMVPDLLREHIIFEAFFSDGHKFDFTEKIIKPFFAQRGDRIFRSLALGEALGGKGAKAILDAELSNIRTIVKDMDNAKRTMVLNWLKRLAYFRPEESLLILRNILVNPSIETISINHDRWGALTFSTKDILRKATEILCETWQYNESCLKETLSLLYLIASQQDHSRMNQDPTGDALRVLTEQVIVIQPGKSTRVQEIALDTIEKWEAENPSKAQQIIIGNCLSVLLSVTWTTTESTAIDANRFTITSGTLAIKQPLLAIRERSIQLSKKLYAHAESEMRINIIDHMGSVLGPYLKETLSDELKQMLTADAHTIFSFFEKVSKAEAVPERYAIWKTLKRLHAFGYISSLPRFFKQLYTDDVEMYAHLTAWPGHLRDIEVGYKEAEKEHQDYWHHMVSSLTTDNLPNFLNRLDQLIYGASSSDLSAIAINIRIIATFLKNQSPDWLSESTDTIPDKYNQLKKYVGCFLGTLYLVNHKKASSIADNWINRGDVIIQRQVCEAMLYLKPEEFNQAELKQIVNLANLKDPAIESALTFPGQHIKRLETKFHDKAIALLKDFAGHCQEYVIENIAHLLNEPEKHESLFIRDIELNDFRELAFALIRFPDLDSGHMYYFEGMLKRLYQMDFGVWLEFWEARIKHQQQVGARSGYHAAPFHLSRDGSNDYVVSSENRVQVLGTFLDWSSRDGWAYKYYGTLLFKLFSGGNATAINDILDNWLASNEVTKLRTVAHVLREMGYSAYFLEMALRLLEKTDDEIVEASLTSAIWTTGTVSGSLVTVWEKRLKDLEKWLADSTISLRARQFAKRLITDLKKNIELEEDDD